MIKEICDICTSPEKGKFTKCQKCEKLFGQKTGLQTHTRTVHEKLRDYKCHICEKLFGRKIGLQSHFAKTHERIIPEWLTLEIPKYENTEN